MENYITIDDVRHYIMDREAEDNELEMDLSFTDDEITKALQSAMRDYNSTIPLCSSYDNPAQLSGDTNMFLDGATAHLYMALWNRLTRSDIDYTAGGVTTNLVAKQIAHCKDKIKLYGDRFKETATNIKIQINVNAAWGHF